MKVAGYDDMAPIIPEGQVGDYKITHLRKTLRQVQLETLLHSSTDWTMRFARAGTYCILWNSVRHETTMSDTDFERVTNREALCDAHGHVLIGGLGIGMLPYHLCKRRCIKSITVVELQQDVIDLVAPHIEHEKLRVIQGDMTRPLPPRLKYQPYDYIYLDIWSAVGEIEWKELYALLASYRKYLAPNGKVDAWLSEYIRIFDALGVAKLPNMYRPLSGWLNRGTRRELVKAMASTYRRGGEHDVSEHPS